MTILPALLEALSADVITEPDEIDSRYFGDWMLRDESAHPAALARPRTTQDVATLLKTCQAHGVPVVAQGGRTGLAGGATPVPGCVLLSLERMRAISPVDGASATVLVECGAVLETVQQAADAAGLLFALDIGGRGSCTIGGNISTNAGGNRVLRYGMMRELVVGLEAVLADGTIISALSPMQKNNTGYDLKQLFIGSEGTLGVVTRAVLRLHPKPSTVQTALLALKDYAAVLALLAAAKSHLGSNLAAFEVMWPHFYELGTSGLGRQPPLALGHGAYVLIESMGTDSSHDDAHFEAFVEAVFNQDIVADAVIAQSEGQRRQIWAVRDSSGEFPRTFWPNVGYDVSLPIGEIGRFIETCDTRLTARWPQVRTVWFGHAADGNVHIAVHLPDASEQPEPAFDDIVYGCVADFSGSISAEHGIGILKKPYLGKSRTTAEIATMKLLKKALDPRGILNPGKIFDQG
ncbi:FAD-binding oxidoreductase [Novosphingobium sp.]|uniref:FAD-binding oxidoreductase n=1 Tax=Novosphingobium sp. TaxID=1874826 RepID=UPI002B486EF0|nr:FAD-binding oxidoreductase [Novosphingobium sp.]HKR93642.1 FAD-binding oxidoreductase [Novosphingobium sp.]